jgi:hypothetical protein
MGLGLVDELPDVRGPGFVGGAPAGDKIVVNPSHPDFRMIVARRPTPLRGDQRLLALMGGG